MKKEMDIFEPPKMQNNYESYTMERVTSINGGSDPLEFRITGSGKDYMSLRKHYLVLDVQILTSAAEDYLKLTKRHQLTTLFIRFGMISK